MYSSMFVELSTGVQSADLREIAILQNERGRNSHHNRRCPAVDSSPEQVSQPMVGSTR